MSAEKLTQERLKELLHYDPETGIFTRIVDSGYRNIYKKGTIPGGIDQYGYVVIGLGDDKKQWLDSIPEDISNGFLKYRKDLKNVNPDPQDQQEATKKE